MTNLMSNHNFFIRMKASYHAFYGYWAPEIPLLAGNVRNMAEVFAAINTYAANPAADAAHITKMAIFGYPDILGSMAGEIDDGDY